MRLSEVVERCPTARLATRADNARILEFFEQTSMQTSAFDVQYRRRPDFFKLLDYQSDRSFVLVSEDRRGALQGVGSLSLRPGWVGGQPTTVGYLGDLRIRWSRDLPSAWRGLFSDLVSRAGEIDELRECTHWFTVVLDGNRAARAAFQDDRRTGGRRRAESPRLVPIAPFKMRNLMMRMPFSGRSRLPREWRLQQAGDGDHAMLRAFMEEVNRRMLMGFRGELDRRIAAWEGLSIRDFVYVSDPQGVVACMAPWSPCVAKQTVVSRVPRSLRLLGRAARWLPGSSLRVPEDGEPLRTPYLTHLTFAARLSPESRARAFRVMLDDVFDRGKRSDWHGVALCDFESWNLGRDLGGFVQHTVPITLYAVVPPGQQDRMKPAEDAAPPAFEMAMV
jgi:hypothetical protein